MPFRSTTWAGIFVGIAATYAFWVGVDVGRHAQTELAPATPSSVPSTLPHPPCAQVSTGKTADAEGRKDGETVAAVPEALTGLWRQVDAAEGSRRLRFWYFHGDGKGLSREWNLPSTPWPRRRPRRPAATRPRAFLEISVPKKGRSGRPAAGTPASRVSSWGAGPSPWPPSLPR